MAPRQVALPVPHYRSGRRSRVRLLVGHTAEGARTMASLAAFLRRLGTASYHGGSDDELIGYLVNRKHEAWHCRGANPLSDGFVLCGFAGWSQAEWRRHPVMLENFAWWLASCARERGLPLRWLSDREVRDAVHDPQHPGGVCDHWAYSRATADGDHWDVGLHLPWDELLAWAAEIQAETTAPKPPAVPTSQRLMEDHTMLLRTDPDRAEWVSYFFEPGTLASITLGWGSPGELIEAKWWFRQGGWEEGRKPVGIDLARWAHGGLQPHHMSLVWEPPAGADCLELAFRAPGQGLHIVGTPV